MKIAALVLLLLPLHPAPADEHSLRLDGVGQAVAGLAEESSGGNTSREALKKLHLALTGSRPNVWNLDDRFLSEIREMMEPVRGLAGSLSESPDKYDRFYAAIIGSYLSPTPQSQEILFKLAHDEDLPTAEAAMATLFGMGWETAELREELVKSLEAAASGEPSTMGSLARLHAGEWGVVEAVPVLAGILDKEYREQGKVSSIVVQLSYLGTRAKSSAALLEKILGDYRMKQAADRKVLGALENATLSLNGKIEPPYGGGPRLDSPVSAAIAMRSASRPAIAKPLASRSLDSGGASAARPLLPLAAAALACTLAALFIWLRTRCRKAL